eukprot:Seg2073.3 transcript_id=Seg2073.3/GoldUCD/mRNA.D3Y31 product="Deoxyribodipyrimidine photo-lyase" protein_id=Seg2073.3/GoldUCD/D3Y31
MADSKRTSKRKAQSEASNTSTKKKPKTDIEDKGESSKGPATDLKSFYAAQREKAVPAGEKEFKFNKKRVRMISKTKELPEDCEGVLYWMFRDQRVEDNWALLWAQRMAIKQEVPLYVTFCLPSSYLDATIRQYNFMIEGLKNVEEVSPLSIVYKF